MGQNPSGLGKDPAPLNLKPRILELGNLGLGKIWQGAGLVDLARRAPPTGAADGLPPLPPTSDFSVCVLGVLDCGFVVLRFVSLGSCRFVQIAPDSCR